MDSPWSNGVDSDRTGEIRVECEVAPRHLTICECRQPWREDVRPDWTRFPIARLHYTRTTGLWTLYWRDQNLKYHRTNLSIPAPESKTCLTTSMTVLIPSSGDNDQLTWSN